MTNQSLTEFIDQRADNFKAIAPPHIRYEAEKRFAIQLLNNNSYLMKVALENKRSLADSIDNVAAIGLSLNPAEKLAYLIPRTLKENGKYISKIFLEPSYMGLIKLASDSGSIIWVQANCVYENDTFIDNGPGNLPTHSYNAFCKNRGEFMGAYCIAKTHSNDYLTTIMTKEEIENIMERSESVKAFRSGKGFGGPWVTDFTEQAKKTVIRRASKLWPKKTIRFMNAINISNSNEGFETIENNPTISRFTADQKNYFDQLIENNNALKMYIFYESLVNSDASSHGASVWIDLLHSFEFGSKGKYKKIAHELVQKGCQDLDSYTASIIDLLENEDIAVLELIDEIDDETIKLIHDRLEAPHSKLLFDMLKEHDKTMQ